MRSVRWGGYPDTSPGCETNHSCETSLSSEVACLLGVRSGEVASLYSAQQPHKAACMLVEQNTLIPQLKESVLKSLYK